MAESVPTKRSRLQSRSNKGVVSMAMIQPVFGDISLNGVNYRIEIGTYRVRDIVDFAPRASAPGGSIIHSELGLYQPY